MLVKETKNRAHHAFHVYCPACKDAHSFDTRLWTFDGNFIKPTFSPSMLVTWEANGHQKRICHSFVHNGVWKFLSDCTHEMKNTEVPVIPFPENYGFTE